MRRIAGPVLVLALLLPAVPTGAAARHARPHVAVRAVPPGSDVAVPPSLPADGPLPLYRREAALPVAAGWPGRADFPRTSGTGRLSHGGFFWTDWLYDDHGAVGASTGPLAVQAGSPTFGTYTYPDGAAHANGADIFRAAVQRGVDETYWRVDWTTLADVHVPLAVWTFDTDNSTATGSSAWPASAGVRSPGIDRALVVSARGARLLDANGAVLATLPVRVDPAARSFVVAVPTSVLAPSGTWRVRLGAGLADASGQGLAAPIGALPGGARLYNVTFRSRSLEPTKFSYWDDMTQTLDLTSGDVSAFSQTIDWAALGAGTTTPEEQPKGWSDRWYVSSVDLGPGLLAGPSSIADGRANFLGRVQPYAVYVPQSYTGSATPLTFLLHSLTQNHNQYAATTPSFTRQACEQRHSICVTTLGRGPDGDYKAEAELDFWEVWHAVASAYRLDPERTVLSGYSMGGIGTNRLATAHPDLFARAVTLAGAIGADPDQVNLRWVPVYLAGGSADELVPVTDERAEADALDALGYRYRWLIILGTDHVAYELSDSFADAAAYMGDAPRVRWPGHVTFRWRGSAAIPRLHLGTTGAYWLRDLLARTPGAVSLIEATSGQRPDPAVTVQRTSGLDPAAGPGPARVQQLAWAQGARGAKRPVITMTLTNVRSLVVRLDGAGFAKGQRGTLDVTSDGAVRIRLGKLVHVVPAGHHVLAFTA